MSAHRTPTAGNRPQTIQLSGGNTQLANLCGPLDENLRRIEQAHDVSISRRGNRFSIRGARAAETSQALRWFHDQSAQTPLSLDALQLGLVELGSRGTASSVADRPVSHLPDLPDVDDEEGFSLRTRKSDLRPRTPRQRDYLKAILSHDVTFGVGPAGTGKTWLAVACAIDALERESVTRLVLTRPAVEAGERLGFLPGDLVQKVDPYLRPLYDALYDLLGFEKTQRFFEKQTIEIAPLAYMRGRTLNHSFIILDEAQNTTPEQMKMFLTRIGFGSKAVINGDPSQVDLPKSQKSGLLHALDVLDGVSGIAQTRFTSRDVVRHPLVAKIVDAYEKAGDHVS